MDFAFPWIEMAITVQNRSRKLSLKAMESQDSSPEVFCVNDLLVLVISPGIHSPPQTSVTYVTLEAACKWLMTDWQLLSQVHNITIRETRAPLFDLMDRFGDQHIRTDNECGFVQFDLNCRIYFHTEKEVHVTKWLWLTFCGFWPTVLIAFVVNQSSNGVVCLFKNLSYVYVSQPITANLIQGELTKSILQICINMHTWMNGAYKDVGKLPPSKLG